MDFSEKTDMTSLPNLALTFQHQMFGSADKRNSGSTRKRTAYAMQQTKTYRMALR